MVTTDLDLEATKRALVRKRRASQAFSELVDVSEKAALTAGTVARLVEAGEAYLAALHAQVLDLRAKEAGLYASAAREYLGPRTVDADAATAIAAEVRHMADAAIAKARALEEAPATSGGDR